MSKIMIFVGYLHLDEGNHINPDGTILHRAACQPLSP